MTKSIAQIVTLIVFCASTGLGVTDVALKSAKQQTLRISASLQRQRTPTLGALDSLSVVIEQICMSDSSALPHLSTFSLHWRDELERVSLLLRLFRQAYEAGCRGESLQVQFHQFAASFHLFFCDYFLAQARQHGSVTMLLFAPSISCECTKRMSMEYECMLDSIMAESGPAVELIVIDTFSRQDLMSGYAITDLPAIVLLDRANNEVQRWVRQEAIAPEVGVALKNELERD